MSAKKPRKVHPATVARLRRQWERETNITITINGRVVQRASIAELRAMVQMLGQPWLGGVHLNFGGDWRRWASCNLECCE